MSKSTIKILEKLRDDFVVANAIDCHCGGRPGCPTCMGVGRFTPDGIYNIYVQASVFSSVVDLALELAPESGYTELRSALRWTQSYKQDALIDLMARDETFDPQHVVAMIEESFDTAGLPMRGLMREMLRFVKTLPRGPLTKKELKTHLKNFREEE